MPTIRATPPAAGTTITSGALESGDRRKNAICRPSGDQTGEDDSAASEVRGAAFSPLIAFT